VARRVHEMSFGSRSDCEGTCSAFRRRNWRRQSKANNGRAQDQLERLRTTCEYRNSADTVPTADSLAINGALAPASSDADAGKQLETRPRLPGTFWRKITGPLHLLLR